MTPTGVRRDRRASTLRTRAGESREDLTEFVREHRNWLKKVAVFHGARPDEADDIVGDALVELAQRWSEIDYPRAYAQRVMMNRVRAAHRNRQRLPIIEPLAQVHDGHDLHEPAQHEPVFHEIETQLCVEALAQGLPARQATIFRLLFEGMTAPEIAEVVGGTPAAVRKNAQLIRDRMRDVFPQGARDLYGVTPETRRQAP